MLREILAMPAVQLTIAIILGIIILASWRQILKYLIYIVALAILIGIFLYLNNQYHFVNIPFDR